MNTDLTEQERAALEALVDATNLNAVLQGLSEIAGAKGDHIETNYENSLTLARAWHAAEGAIGLLATDKHIMAVS